MGLTTGQYLAGGAVLLVISSVAEGRNGAEWGSGKLWLAVAFISIVGSALATVAYFGALRHLTATRVVTWGFLSPVIAVGLEIVLGHTPSAVVLVGHGGHDRRRRRRHLGGCAASVDCSHRRAGCGCSISVRHELKEEERERKRSRDVIEEVKE